ncbi:hypothetical protein BH20ACT1_BH20ACT1_09190 [soil metagenome]|jgi:hypothetical protein
MSTIQNLELERRWLDAHVDGLIDDLPALALLSDPEVVCFGELTTGLDARARRST